MQIWYINFPLHQYNEGVKELAIKNKLKIVDARFQGNEKQCDNAPKLTKVGEKPTKPKKEEVSE